jgi:uncharacterized protein YjiS (DUF1127 family)
MNCKRLFISNDQQIIPHIEKIRRDRMNLLSIFGRRSSVRALSDLDEALLKDLGVSRQDVRRAMRMCTVDAAALLNTARMENARNPN